ncbi:Non-specific lipid-transfer protein [Penicillium manginii]|uniref:Non-specific lipid-transfer protein n=1 Tax=Penicillium manginii TaxID=203109 RepID=UPI002549658C|nr:Non-specific lipid-transfer protein [Penicillium manginii]KAJ5763394.1 Non-specific lipid-transfer protein [Penicillium manginii]
MVKKATSPAYVLGVGMTKFIKPRGKVDYNELGYEAGIKAMLDAQITYDDVDQGVACYVYGDSTCGQRVFYQFGLTQIPIYNVNNNCSTGSTGLAMARTMVSHGAADCVLVVGFEKMNPGSLQSMYNDRANPTGLFGTMMAETRGVTNAPAPPRCSAMLALNTKRSTAQQTKTSLKSPGSTTNTPSATPTPNSNKNTPLDQIMKSPMIHEPLTKLQCCPTSDGGAAAVIVSQEFLDARPHLKENAILIAGQTLASDTDQVYNQSSIDLMGFGMSRYAARTAIAEAGVNVKDIKVCELHDCFSANEMITIDALELSEPGKAHEMVRKGDITYGGKMVINPSGGLISKGHPLGATGIAQCAELVWHLRGWANNRLIDGTNAALQHNLGLGGAVVVTVYKRADGKVAAAVPSDVVGKVNKLGYNPAVEARGFTAAQAKSVISQKHSSEYAVADAQERVLARF